MTPELEGLQKDIHGLSLELAGLKPLVKEVHNHIPRITNALETLADVSARLENNVEEHKRIHFRITEHDKDITKLKADHESLDHRFSVLKEEHVICMTTKRVERA